MTKCALLWIVEATRQYNLPTSLSTQKRKTLNKDFVEIKTSTKAKKKINFGFTLFDYSVA